MTLQGFGVTVRDLLSDGTTLIADMGFGSTAQPGLVFASRLLFHEGFAMTGGAALACWRATGSSAPGNNRENGKGGGTR